MLLLNHDLFTQTLLVLSDDVVEAYNLIKDLEPTTPQVTNNHC